MTNKPNETLTTPLKGLILGALVLAGVMATRVKEITSTSEQTENNIDALQGEMKALAHDLLIESEKKDPTRGITFPILDEQGNPSRAVFIGRNENRDIFIQAPFTSAELSSAATLRKIIRSLRIVKGIIKTGKPSGEENINKLLAK